MSALIKAAVTLAVSLLLIVLALYVTVSLEYLITKLLGVGIEHLIGALLLILACTTVKNEL